MSKLLTSIIFISFLSVFAFADYLTVTSPAGGERFKIGDTINITWTNSYNLSGNVKISLCRVGYRQEIIIHQSYPIKNLRFPYPLGGPLISGKFVVEVRKNLEIKNLFGYHSFLGAFESAYNL